MNALNNGIVVMETAVEGQILKYDDEQRLVYGWASVISEKGVPLIDRQGDTISAETMTKAATEFMLNTRTTKAMHTGNKVGEFIHSFPLTTELAKAFGISCDKEGWLVCAKVYDDKTWQKVKSGELKAFSIGGRAKREVI